MAIRRRELHPDETFITRAGREIPVVSEEQYLAALVDLGRFQLFAGGVITAVNFRAPTDLDGEMVTVGGVLEWKDRTDARPQPEPVAQPNPEIAGLTALATSPEVLTPEWGDDNGDDPPEVVHEEDPAPRAAVPAPPASRDGIGDGLEGIDPNAEDVSEIPEHLRA